MATYSVNWSARLASTAGTVAVGMCLVILSDGTHLVATTANRTSYGRSVGIAATAGGATVVDVQMIEVGIVPPSLTGLAAGTVSWVRVTSTGTLERCTPGSGDDIVGKVHADGNLQFCPGMFDSANYAGGGGGSFTAPTGTGLMTTTSGAMDAASAPYGAGFLTWVATPSSANLATLVTDETGTGALVFGTAPLFKTSINLNNPANTFKYVFTPDAILADRILNLPLLAATDTVAVLAFAQTFTNKTINVADNSLTSTSGALGDLLYHNGTKFVRLPRGTANQVLTTNAGGTDISWAAAAGGFTAPTGSGLMTTTSSAMNGASAPVGTGVLTFLATPSSANLKSAVTDETGSGGALVFATSPTLTTPTLADPTVTGTVTFQGTKMRVLSIPGEATSTTTSAVNPVQFSQVADTTVRYDFTAVMKAVDAISSSNAGGSYSGSVTYRRDTAASLAICGAAAYGTPQTGIAGDTCLFAVSGATVLVQCTSADADDRNWTVELRVHETLGT